MITFKIFEIFAAIIDFFFSGTETFSISVDFALFEPVRNTLGFIMYMLPMDGLFVIVDIIVMINLFRIVIALLKTIWDILPIL